MMLLALLATCVPATAAIWRYGSPAAFTLLCGVAASWLAESLWTRAPSRDASVLLTGMICALLLPASAPTWLGALAGALGCIAGRRIWGGLGANPFNPAAVARVLLMILLPLHMFAPRWPIDGLTAATPLAKEIGAIAPTLLTLLHGDHAGTLAEASPIAVVAAGLFIVATRIADWRIPVSYLAGVAIFATVLPAGDRMLGHAPWLVASPATHLLTGGALFAGFFMLTDPVTAPFTRSGRVAYGLLAAAFTVVVRSHTQFPDAAVLAVLLANASAGWLDSLALRRVFASRRLSPAPER